jgi:signal transduction histidine kinase/ligand-binding sensor domain-containing protein/DNA-binding response OmpR family regulator
MTRKTGIMLKYIGLIAGIILLILPDTKGQNNELNFHTISTLNGLTDNNIHCVIQDSKGFMWFGSEEGLHRYDGYNIKVFRHNPEKPSLSNNFIRALYEDDFGRLWIGTDGGGISLYDLNTESFHYLRLNEQKPEEGLLSDDIFCFAPSKNGNLWVGTKLGLTLLELNRKENHKKKPVLSFKHFQHDPNHPKSLANPNVYSVFEDSYGILWAGTTEGGLSRLDPGKKEFTNYRPSGQQQGTISGLGIMTIYEDKHNNLWVGTWAHGLNLYNRSQDQFTTYTHNPKDTTSLSHDNIYSICEDLSGNLWIATYDGGINRLLSYEDEKLHFQRYMTRTDELMSFYKNRVKVIYPDRAGSLWAGTLGNGITQISQTPTMFKHITQSTLHHGHLIDNYINHIYPLASDSALISSPNGLQVISWRSTPNPTSFSSHSQLIDSIAFPEFLNRNITTAMRDNKGHFWIGSKNQGLYRYTPNATNQPELLHFNSFKSAPFKIPNQEIIQVLEKNNQLWLITRTHICLYSYADEKFIWNDANGHLLFPFNGDANVVHIDKKHRLLLGTEYEGLFVFQYSVTPTVQTQLLANYKTDSEQLELASEQILSLYDGPDNQVWVGTAKGVHLIDLDSKSNISYKEKDGLPAASVTQIFQDNLGHYWFATMQGLGRLDTVSNIISPFYMSGGFRSNFFTPAKTYFYNDNLAILPTNNGLWYFYPDSIQTNPIFAQPTLTSLQIAGQQVIPGLKTTNRVITNKALHQTKEIVLQHNENVLNFEFSGLTYYKQHLNKFNYILEGLDNHWNLTDANHRTVTYSNLSPKEYVFRLKAANSDGIWNPEETTLKIIIKPPYYKTWWAYLIYVLVTLTGVIAIQRFMVNRIRLRESLNQEKVAREREASLNQMKIKFFTNISHEFRTPLSLISGPIKEILDEEDYSPKKVKPQLEMIKRNSDRLLRLINQLMDFRKVMQGNMKLQVQKGNLSEFAQRVADSFMGAAAQKHIHFQMDIDTNYEHSWYDPNKVETILFNLLSNAFKYTPKNGNILLEVSYHNEYAHFTVSDSGPGINDEDKKHIFDRFYQSKKAHNQGEAGTGVGLSLVKDFVELHKGEIQIHSEEGEGASFEVNIGIKKSLFTEDQIIETSTETAPLTETLVIEEANETPVNNDDQSNKPLILIVEDNNDVQQYLLNILKPLYRVETAINGVKGLEKASATLPALILSDVMMPEMDGFEFCGKVKKNVITSHIPVIMLTALGGVDSKVEGMDQGADAYLTKPFEKKVLLSQIKNLLQNRKHLKERFSEQWDFVEEIATTSADKQFVNRAVKLVEEMMNNPHFNVSEMVKKMNVSRTLLHMKLRELTGQSTSEFIRTIRLKRAAKLLKQGDKNVSEVTYAVGFNDPKYFSKSFKGLFGLTPTQFQKGDASNGISTLLDEDDE